MATFAEGTKPPMQVLEDGSTRPLTAGEAAEASGNPGIDLHSDAFVGTNVEFSGPVRRYGFQQRAGTRLTRLRPAMP